MKRFGSLRHYSSKELMMKSFVIVLVIVAIAATASAQPKADLQIVKTYRPPGNAGPSAFVLTVTNNGPQTAPSPIQVIDALPAGVIWATATFTFPISCSGNTCTYSWPLAPGQSFTIVRPVMITTATSNVLNCASVNPVAGTTDPTHANNRDCACIDINPCSNIFIDLTTGIQDGVTLQATAADLDWHPNNSIAAVTASKPWNTPPQGRFITVNPVLNNQAQPQPAGSYDFSFPFTLAPHWQNGECVLKAEFRGDDCVSLRVDNNAVFAQTPPVNCNTALASSKSTSATYILPSPPGNHMLHASVFNNQGLVGLWLSGSIICQCTSPIP
jgi:uncharacterized repeat protein (TIGR01451 family)